MKQWGSGFFSAGEPDQPRGPRGLVVVELVLVSVFVLVHIWEPADWLAGPGSRAAVRLAVRATAVAVVAVCLVGSMWRLRESRSQLGLTLGQMRKGWGSMAVFTGISLALVVAGGLALAEPMNLAERGLWLAKYVPTMIGQQLVLQWFFNNRVYYLARGGPRRRRAVAVAVATGVFVLWHGPNIALMAGVAWSGWFWCRHFREYRNLAATMASHAVLGIAAMALLGPGAMMNLRVGWPALVWMREHGGWWM